MVRKSERKKLSMKTRLLIIVAMFIVINLAFYMGTEFSDKSESEKQTDQPSQPVQEETQEQLYDKFNPPSSSP